MDTKRIDPWGAFPAMLLLLALLPAIARAQQTMDSRWLPWLGCWLPAVEQAGGDDPLVCVRPVSGENGVTISRVAGGETVSTRTLLADGQAHDLTDGDCSGWQTAGFSGDGQRVFLRSDLLCADGVKRTASAILAMASPTEWLDAQAVGRDGEHMPRAARYRPALPSLWPAEFALPIDRAEIVAEARLVASARLSVRDVEEAVTRVDREALIAFLVERDQAFELDATALSNLADVGVAEDVIDMMVAVSYPERFGIDRQTMRTALAPAEGPAGDRSGSGDPFGWGPWGRGGYGYGACYGGGLWSWYCDPFLYTPYGYSRYGYGSYDPYGYGYWGQPVIVVRGNDAAGGEQGRAVRGRGYTRGGRPVDSSDDRQARDRTGGSQGSVRSGGGSSSSGGRTGSPGSSGGGRTAKPRGGQ